MLSLQELALVVNGRLSSGDSEFSSVSIDTRTLEPGALFVAIDGERVRGSDYVSQAKSAGAVAVLSQRSHDGLLPGVVVDDPIKALGQLAAFWRNQLSLPIVGITGSNGKTTVKEMVASILSKSGSVYASPGNFNNHIGAPLTLLGVRPTHRFAVVEMGMNHAGEIDYLTRIVQPTVAVITNAALAHLEGLGSLSEVVRAKAEIFNGLRSGGTAIINADDRFAAYWAARTQAFQTITFGLNSGARVGGEVSTSEDGQLIELRLPDESIEIQLGLLGRHNALNAMAAASAAWACGCSATDIRSGLEAMRAQPGRLQVRAGSRGASLIDDTYNANPASLRAAIKTLAGRSGRKMLILGNMAELGERAEDLHRQAGREARDAGIDMLFARGDLAALAAEAFGESGQSFDSTDSLIRAARSFLSPGLTVLIKGSRSARMEQVANALVCASQEGAIAC